MRFKVGDVVEIVSNDSGGFENGEVVKVVKVTDRGEYDNLLLFGRNEHYYHVDDEVKLFEGRKNN